jgi:hypothetical protein
LNVRFSQAIIKMIIVLIFAYFLIRRDEKLKVRKKLLGLFLTIALIMGVTPTAFADSGNDTAQKEETTTDQEQQSDAAATSSTSAESDTSTSTNDGAGTDSSTSDGAGTDAATSGETDTAATVSGKTDTVSSTSEETDTDSSDLSVTSNNASGIQIQYDSDTTIHYVTQSDGTEIILYCMNNELHWPHTTDTITNVPTYTEATFEDFFDANGITGDAQATLKTELENLLYAGYSYNGYGLYQIVDSVPTISEEEFNELLTPPQYLRDDFPDTLGNNTFTYADRTDSSKMSILTSFLQATGEYYAGGTTSSGLTYQQLIRLPFWRAAYCMVYFSGDPIESYSNLYLADYYVTQEQAYGGTRDAIWSLLKSAGLPNNGASVTETTFVQKLLAADTTNLIPTEEPSSDEISVTKPTFYYSAADQKWHTGSLTITAPSTYNTYFTLNLPDGVTEESGRTQIRAGESFSLVSSTRPSDSMSITLSATVPWMDPALKVYVADSSVTASDGKGFQNMIGAVIRQTPVSVTANLSSSSTDFTFTKVWDDGNDQDGIRPNQAAFISSLHLYANGVELTGYTPTVTDNGDGSWTVTYSDLPGLMSGETYTVTEDRMASYTADTNTVENGGTLTNQHIPETVDLSGTKTWDDENDQDGKRPDSITVNLLADGVPTDSTVVQASADGTWTYSFTDLPKYKDGKEITYTVTEDEVRDYSTVINGYDITNEYTPGKTSVTVTKAWDDEENQDGIRPETVQVQLYADGAASGDPVTLTAADGWTYTWSDLDEMSGGKAIAYTVQEVSGAEGYTSSVMGSMETGYTITNSHTPATVDVSGTKTWDDNNDQDGKRPESITVNLLADGVQIDSTVVQAAADGTWTYSFTDLPKYKDGNVISYTVTENALSDYSTEINGYDITNSHTPGQTSVTVTKAWDDEENQDGKRPATVQVQLYADGVASGDPVTLTAADGWTYTWENLDEMSGGKAISYTVQEASEVEGYISLVTGSMETGYTITNSHAPETVDLSGTKTWDDGNDQDGKRPESITVNLLADGVPTDSTVVQAAADGTWTYRFTDLPKYKDGQEITYTVTEDEVSDYSTTISGYDITNQYTPGKTSVTVTKAWYDEENQDGKRPTTVEVQLYADGVASGDPVTLTAADGWAYTWENLDEMSGGKKIAYTVQETSEVDGYTSEVTGDAEKGYIITNSHTPETVDVSGTKTWDDGDDQDGKRPESITVNLLADGVPTDSTVVQAASDGTWTYRFTGLPKYRDGKEIVYTVTENAVSDYSTSISGYDITNQHTPGQTSVTVTKAWDDQNDQNGKRPDSVQIQLYADGVALGDPVTLTAADGWTYTWNGLDEMSGGNKIIYTVQEVSDVEGYTSTATGNAETGFTVTNTLDPVSGEGAVSANASSSPGTGDHSNALLYGILAAIALLALALLVRRGKKHR